MTHAEIVRALADRSERGVTRDDVERALSLMALAMGQALLDGGRIEIRGFGSFSVHDRAPRVGRNPRSGAPLVIAAKKVPHFKPGKLMRQRLKTLNLQAQTDRDHEDDSA